MATRTISNTGGNWNATGTWVEAIVPTAADDVVATATSGQLTLNVSASIRTVNFTNYTNTLTMSNNLAIGAGTGLTNTFVNTMTIVGAARLRFVGVCTLVTNGLVLPVVEITATIVLSGTLNCGNLVVTPASISGANIVVSGNVTYTGNSTFNIGGHKLSLVGTQSHTYAGFNFQNGQLEVNCGAGTYSFVDNTSLASGVILQPSTNGTTFSYVSGNIINPTIRCGNNTTGKLAIDFGSYSAGLDSILVKLNQTSDLDFTLVSNLVYKNMVIMTEFTVPTATLTRRSFNLVGPGVLMGSPTTETFILPSFRGSSAIAAWRAIGQAIRLQSGLTYSFGNLYSYGFDNNLTTTSEDGNNIFYSSTPGTRAGINVVGTQSITFTDFTDISASQSVYTVLGQTSNVTNVTSIDRYYYTAGGGVSGGSFTFVN